MTPAEHHATRRKDARQKGLCQLCPKQHQRPARPGRSTCIECAAGVLRAQRKRLKRLHAAGLCARNCGRKRTHGIYCEEHYQHRQTLPSAGRNVTHERRVKANLCRNGCGRSAFKGTRCKECAEEEAAARKTAAIERVEEGLCYRCGRCPAPEGESCIQCKQKRRSKHDGRRSPTPLALLRCGACGELGHKKSARRCRLWRGMTF